MSKLLDLWADMTGVVLDYAFSIPPSAQWLMCYGQALTTGDSATARLRAKLIADGNPYGVDGSGNPLVPDARGRATAGKDDMGGAAAGRLTAAGAGINGTVLGAAGGAQTHTLTTAQMPSHNHGINDPGHSHSVNDPTHSHGTSPSGSLLGNNGSGVALSTSGGTLVNYSTSIAASGTGISLQSATVGVSTQNNGSGGAHPITQPTLVLNKIIRL